MECQHKILQKCEMGDLVWYCCTECRDNFNVQPDAIDVFYPSAPPEKK